MARVRGNDDMGLCSESQVIDLCSFDLDVLLLGHRILRCLFWLSKLHIIVVAACGSHLPRLAIKVLPTLTSRR